MTATEAIIYCLTCTERIVSDGERQTTPVYDRLGNPHWIAWRIAHGDAATPDFHSESAMPFAERMGPYVAEGKEL